MSKAKDGKSRALAIVQKFAPRVMSVRDGTDEIEVEVTKRDVSVARKQDHGGCAMAVACARAAKADGMIVSISTAYVIRGTVAYRFKLPPSVSREITSFDRGAAFAPGIYHLRPPGEAEGLGQARNVRGGHSRDGNGKGAPPTKHLTEEIRAVLHGRARRLPAA